jgi:hypothetical protein
MGEAPRVRHQGAALLHQPLQGAPGNALRRQGGQPVAVSHQPCERQLRLRGIVLRVAETEGVAILRSQGGMDGTQHEAVVRLQRGYQRPLAQFQAHGEGATFEAVSPRLRPLGHVLRTMGQHADLARVATRRLQTDIRLAIGPVEADAGRLLRAGGRVHGAPPKWWSRGQGRRAGLAAKAV